MDDVVSSLTLLERPERSTTSAAEISVIVPVHERPEPLGELYKEFAGPLKELARPIEFVFVCQPWCDPLVEPLADLVRSGEPIRVLKAVHAQMEATLLKLGVRYARGDVVIALPAYRRIDAACLPALVERVDAGADLAVARRWPRCDSWVNRLQNRLFNGLLRSLTGARLADVACGVYATRREMISEIALYGDFSRFLPLLAWREGYQVEEHALPQHERDTQPRIHSTGVYLRRLLDILGIYFLMRFTDKPLRFFGLLGSATTAVGGVILGILFVQRIGGQGIADRPMLLLGVLLVVLGIQAIALGLVGEIIVHLHAPTMRTYRVVRETLTSGTVDAGRQSDEPARRSRM